MRESSGVISNTFAPSATLGSITLSTKLLTARVTIAALVPLRTILLPYIAQAKSRVLSPFTASADSGRSVSPTSISKVSVFSAAGKSTSRSAVISTPKYFESWLARSIAALTTASEVLTGRMMRKFIFPSANMVSAFSAGTGSLVASPDDVPSEPS